MQSVVATMSISLDGIGSGHHQSLERPFGDVPEGALHRWMFETPEENAAEREAIVSAGAYIMGRNMFSPGRGEWDADWRGWWGEEPPYHAPVFVLTHHAREPLVMKGGTTFHFVTDGLHAALERARAAAGGKDVRIGGGVQTIRAGLDAGLIDEIHLVVSPVLLGRGESLLQGIDLAAAGFRCVEHAGTADALHTVLVRNTF